MSIVARTGPFVPLSVANGHTPGNRLRHFYPPDQGISLGSSAGPDPARPVAPLEPLVKNSRAIPLAMGSITCELGFTKGGQTVATTENGPPLSALAGTSAEGTVTQNRRAGLTVTQRDAERNTTPVPTLGRMAGNRELAAMLGVSVPTLYEMRRSGASLPPRIRIGKHDRYRVEDIQAWLDSQYLDVPTRPRRRPSDSTAA